MIRTITTLLCVAFSLLCTAQNITHAFHDVSMSDALKWLQRHTDRFKIVFIYDDLEDFTITTSVKNKPVPEAIRQMIGFYPIRMSEGEKGEIYVECIHKTERHLKGLVVDENNLPLPYANVTLLSPIDSTMVGGGVTGESGRFVIPNDNGQVIARVSYVGYKTAYRLCSHDNVGTIKMHPDVTTLKEAVVTAAKMQIERDGANYTLRNLGGTIMGNAGNALDLLRWTPGVVVDVNEGISLIGRDGKTEVYIDNRKVTDKTQLKAITSQNIKRVEIIREPDAQYSSSVAAVIKMYTHNPYKDNLGASLMNVLDIKRRVSNITTLTIDGKQGRWSGNASLSYGRINSLASTHELVSIANAHDDERVYEKVDSTTFAGGGNNYAAFAGLNYAFSPSSIIGVQYNGNFNRMDIVERMTQQMTQQRLWGVTMMKDDVSRNSTSASYQWQRNEQSQLLLIADYATSRQKNVQDMAEYLVTRSEGLTFSQGPHTTILKKFLVVNYNDYDIVTATGRYNFTSRDWNNRMGIEWGYTGSTGSVRRNNLVQHSTRHNDWLGVYYVLSKTWGKWRLNAGLRYEYDHTRTSSDDGVIDKTYHSVLPNASVAYAPKQGVDLVLYYRRSLRRPSYSELRPTSYYNNSYQESTGNPLLQPTITDRWAMSVNAKGFSVTLAYRLMDNAIQRIVEYMPSGVIRDYPINIKHSHAWSLDVGYNYSNSWLSLGVQSNATLPHLTYPYIDAERVENTPFASIGINSQFTVARKLMLGCNVHYCTPWTAGFSRNGSILGVNLSAMTTLCRGRLLLGLTANDIFHRSMAPWGKTRYLNVYQESHNSNDTRGITVMARWTFNSISNPFKRRSGNDATLQRTQGN